MANHTPSPVASLDPGAGHRADDVTIRVAGIAEGLEVALEARAPGVYSSIPLVRQLANRVCRLLGLDECDQALADTCCRVRDVGMLTLPDRVLLATSALSPEDWQLINRHPALGADLLGTLRGMDSVADVVRAHHERWDGEGYPDGHRGERIPLLSRVIAGCDTFVALTSDRPYRSGIGVEAALEQLVQERGAQLEPRVVDALVAAVMGIHDTPRGFHSQPVASSSQTVRRPPAKQGPGGGQEAGGLREVIARFEMVPAFGPAVERLLGSLESYGGARRGEVVAVVESDIGLAVALLREAQHTAGRRQITNLPDAVAELDQDQIRETALRLPRAAFPWRTEFEELMHRERVHAQLASRAAQYIARQVEFRNTDDLLAAALLHDVGKLVLAQARPQLVKSIDGKTTSPEQRVREERQAVGLDHASIGGLLLSRWGLAKQLCSTVSAHHSSTAHNDLSALLRLADMAAHQAHGDAVDRKLMLRLGAACGVSAKALRDALFDLPHAGGSQRRRAEPSPLSARETAILRRLAEGKLSKQIAADLGLSPSTVRSYMHNIYGKLAVADRAQAVLRATEMAWI